MDLMFMIRSIFIYCVCFQAVLYVKCADEKPKADGPANSDDTGGQTGGSDSPEGGEGVDEGALQLSTEGTVSSIENVDQSAQSTAGNTSENFLVLITADDEDGSNAKENDNTKFDKNPSDNRCEYDFKDEAKCLEIKHLGRTVWKYDKEKYKGRFPKRAIINENTRVCWIHYENHYEIYKLKLNEWKFIFVSPGKITMVDIKNKGTAPGIIYHSNEELGMIKFSAKNGVLFRGVKEKEKTIWHTNLESEYADTVIITGVGSNEKTLTIYLLDGEPKLYTKYKSLLKSDWWKEMSRKDKKDDDEGGSGGEGTGDGQVAEGQGVVSVELDIKTRKTTDEFYYVKHSDTKSDVYATKPGFLFGRIRQPQLAEAVRSGIIWETDNPTEYVEKVVISGVGSGAKRLITRAPDKSKRCFYRPIKFKSWEEKECVRMISLLPTNKHPSDITIITIDDDDDFKVIENDLTKYVVYQFGVIVQYVLTDEARCVEIKSKKATIWKHEDDKFPNHYIKEVYVNRERGSYVFHRFRSLFLYRHGHEWVSCHPDGHKRFSDSDFKIFGINDDGWSVSEFDRNKYDEENLGSVIKISFKSGVKCVEVKCENRRVWSHGDHPQYEHPKALYFHKEIKILFLEYEENLTFFYRFVDGFWHLVSKVENTKVSESDFKIITKDGDKITENDLTKYRMDSFGCVIGFLFADYLSLIEVHSGGKLIYKFIDDGDQFGYPIGFYVVDSQMQNIVWTYEKSYYEYKGPIIETPPYQELAAESGSAESGMTGDDPAASTSGEDGKEEESPGDDPTSGMTGDDPAASTSAEGVMEEEKS